MDRKYKPANLKGCKPDGDVCMAHHRPLECRHGCTKALWHKCGKTWAGEPPALPLNNRSA